MKQKSAIAVMLAASMIAVTVPGAAVSAAGSNTTTESNRTAETSSEEKNNTTTSDSKEDQAPPAGEKPDSKPDGNPPGGEGQTPPDGEKPDGQPGGEAPDGAGGPGGDGTGAPGGDDASKTVEGQLGSWSMGGTDAATLEGNDYDYHAALYITQDGIDTEKSSTDKITAGTYDESQASHLTIDDSTSGDNGILVENAQYTITDSTLDFLTEADGTDTCDFSGKGSVIAAFGDNAKVTIEDSSIHTAGVATMPVFADAGATVTIKSSTLQSDGGTLYADYMNTPDQGLMVAPPWILGIMGTSRASNMMGNNTTTNVIDSQTSAGAWAVLSTDAGTDMALNIYNTSLTLNNVDESAHIIQAEGGQISETLDNPYTENYGSGYGTYAIGNAVETFAGATLNVGTYATILTGGSVLCTSLEKDQTYELKNAAGDITETYTATEDKATVINSDTFGFMAHQNTNTITLEKGTEVNSGYATFLVKTGDSNETLTAAVDNTKITNGGVLIQVMDNDDTTNGGMMDADAEENTNGGSKNFKSTHTEEAEFNLEDASAGSTEQNFTFTNGSYSGNIYNASGSDGLDGSALNITLGSGAVLDGAAASTSAIHTTYEGSMALKENDCKAFEIAEDASFFAEEFQNTEFGINQYYDIGQVANLIHDNGGNAVNMTLTDDAVWNVTDPSLISSLTIEENAQVVVPGDVVLTVNGTEYTDCTLTAESLEEA